jgi:hypothetical protein
MIVRFNDEKMRTSLTGVEPLPYLDRQAEALPTRFSFESDAQPAHNKRRPPIRVPEISL